MLPSPVHLKLYLEITDLEWDSYDFQADGEKQPTESCLGET